MSHDLPPLRRLFYCLLVGGAVALGARAVNAEPVGAGAQRKSTQAFDDVRPFAQIGRNGNHLVRIAERYLGTRPIRTRGPWCGHFVNLVLRQAGMRPMPGNRAMDGLRAGTRLARPVAGALIVRRHHVEISLGDGRSISGNWGGRVAIHASSRGVVILPRG